MFRTRLSLFSDSPFRYGNKTRVSSHIASKKFGEDVLLFASISRLNREALSLLVESKDSTRSRPKAFWEVFAKRTNESVHLLPTGTLANIARCLEMSPNVNLPIGTCKVMSEFLSNQYNLNRDNVNPKDVLALFHFMNKYLLEIDENLFRNLLLLVEGSIHLIESSKDIDSILLEITSMANRVSRNAEVHDISAIMSDRLGRKKISLNRLNSE